MREWIEKQRNIVDYTLSAMLRRKGKNLALLIVYTAVVFVLASVMFLTHALKQEAALVLQEAPEIVVQRTAAGRHDLIPTDYGEKISAISGVTSVAPRLWGYYYYPSVKANYTVMAPGDFAHQPGSVLVGPGVARSSLVKKGNVMWFTGVDGAATEFKVVGILPAPSELVSSDLVAMSPADFRKLFGIREGFATDLALSVRNPRELSTIASKIVQILPDTRPIIRDEILRTYEAVFGWRQGLVTIALFGAIFAFIILAWDRASGLSAQERRELGILKAIGWETSDVLFVKFWEGTVISLSSFVLGVLLAYLHVFFSSAVLFESVLKGWAVLYPRFRLTPFVNPYQVASLFVMTVVPYTLTTIVPSWRAATLDPDEQMR